MSNNEALSTGLSNTYNQPIAAVMNHKSGSPTSAYLFVGTCSVENPKRSHSGIAQWARAKENTSNSNNNRVTCIQKKIPSTSRAIRSIEGGVIWVRVLVPRTQYSAGGSCLALFSRDDTTAPATPPSGFSPRVPHPLVCKGGEGFRSLTHPAAARTANPAARAGILLRSLDGSHSCALNILVPPRRLWARISGRGVAWWQGRVV